MSKVLENAFEEVKKSKFYFVDDRGNFEVQDAYIFWTNFAGKPNQFGSIARTFNLAVPADIAATLLTLGYRVREEVIGDLVDADGNTVPAKVYFVNIKVNMDSEYPPTIKLFSEYKGKRTQNLITDNEGLAILDSIDIKSCDLAVHSYISKKLEGKCTGYLKTLYVIKESNAVFGGKYDDWDEPNVHEAEACDIDTDNY